MTNNYSWLVNKLSEYSRKYFLLQLFKGLLLLIGVLTIYISMVLVAEYNFYMLSLFRWLFLGGLFILSLTIGYIFIWKSLMWLLFPSRHKLIAQARLVSSHFPELKDHLLNAVELGQLAEKDELVLKSIDQKINTLSPFSFSQYFSFSAVKANLILFCSSLSFFFVLGLVYPGLLNEAGYRLVHLNQQFLRPAPFRFVLETEDLRVIKGSSLELSVRCVGRKLPESLYVNIGGQNFLMTANGDSFSYKLEHIQNSFSIYFTDLEFVSDRYAIEVFPNPVMLSFSVDVFPPDYTQLKSEHFDEVGDLKVPYGSKVNWSFKCEDTDSVFVRIDDMELIGRREEDTFYVSYSCFSEGTYTIFGKSREGERKELISYRIQMIPDLPPDIKAVQYQDSTNFNRFYFKGEIQDDYGFHELSFFIRALDKDTALPLIVVPSLNHQEFYYFADFEQFRYLGSAFNYYFVVRDNDYLNGYKQSTSEVFSFKIPGKDELLKSDKLLFDELEDKFAEAKTLSDQIRKDVKDFNYKSISQNLTDWDKQQFMQQMLKKRDLLENSINQLINKNSQMNNMNSSFGSSEDALLEKQKQIDQLLEEIMNDELRKLFDEFNELSKSFDQERFNQLMNQMNIPIEDLSKQLERNLEMLKRLKVEQRLELIVEELEDLSINEANNIPLLDDDEFDKVIENEQQTNEEISKIGTEYEDVLKLNKELDKQMNLFPIDDDLNKIHEKVNEIQKSSQQKRKKKSIDQIKENQSLINSLIFNVGQMLKQNEMAQTTENLMNLKQILKNLVYVSQNQEEVLNLSVKMNPSDPFINQVVSRQDFISRQMVLIEDSLYALAKRTPAIDSKVNGELMQIRFSLKEIETYLAEGQVGSVTRFQQGAITSLNELALFLDEALKNLEKAMANSMPGDQECDKPGQGGSGSMKKLKQAQQSLKDQLQRMIEGLKSGEKGQMSEQIGKSLIFQEKLKQMVGELLMDDGVGSSAKEQLRSINNLIEQNRVDLIQKNLTDNMIARQNLILDHLLKAEKSEMERDLDEQRESKSAEQFFFSNPMEFFEYKLKEKNKVEDIWYNDYRLRGFYDKKYRDYMNRLKK